MTNTKDNFVPRNIKELKSWMKRECFNGKSYSIGGKPAPFEGFVLNPKGDTFEWYYTERGIIDVLKIFTDEEEACQYAFEQMKDDKSARSHLVGGFESEDLKDKLCRELEERGVEFQVGKIAYDDKNFRYYVSVFGCDHKKVSDLKEKYETGQYRQR